MFIQGDGHVHIYEAFDLSRFFEAALRRSTHLEAPLLLLLTETEDLDYFRWLARAAGDGSEAGPSEALPANLAAGPPPCVWLQPTEEPGSLGFGPPGEARCAGYLLAGQQRVSSDGIEVLALALPDPAAELPADGQCPASKLTQAVRKLGAVAVLPWGLGKWRGPRATRISTLAADPAFARDPLFLLGDSAHRFWPWPAPAVLRGHRVLAGTDPLPVPGAERRIGSYGFRVRGRLDPARPGRSLREALAAAGPIERIGAPASAASVLLDQARYRRGRARAAALAG